MSRYFLFPFLFFFAFSCQYFNAFFNAEKSFNSAISEIKKMDATLSENAGVFSYANEIQLSSAAQKNLDLSIKQAWKIIEFYTDSADYADDAIFLIARAHFFLKDYPKSSELFSDLIDNYPQSEYWQEAWLWLADSYLADGDTLRSGNTLETASLKNFYPEYEVKLLTRRGALAFDGNDHELALAYYNQALKLSDDDNVKMTIHLRLAESYYKIEDYDQSLLNASIAYDEDVDPDISRKALRQIILVYIAKKDVIYTLKWIEEGRSNLDNLVDFPWYELQRGQLYLKRGDWTKAKSQWQQVLEDYPTTYESALAALYISEYYRMETGEYDSSYSYILKASEAAVKKYPQKLEYLRNWKSRLKSVVGMIKDVSLDSLILNRVEKDSAYYSDLENFQLLLQEIQLELQEEMPEQVITTPTANQYRPTYSTGAEKDGADEVDLSEYINTDSLRSIFEKLKTMKMDSLNLTAIDSAQIDSLETISMAIQKDLFKGKKLNFKNPSEVKVNLKKNLFNLAENLLIEFEDFNTAMVYYREYLNYFKDDSTHLDRALFALGYIDWRNGKDPEKISYFDEILQHNPESPSAQKVYFVRGIEIIDEHQVMNNNFEKKYNLAQNLYFAENYDSSLAILSDLFEDEEFSTMIPKTLLMKALIYRDGLKNVDSLLSVYRSLQSDYANSAEYKSIKAEYDILNKYILEKESVNTDSSLIEAADTLAVFPVDTVMNLKSATLADTTVSNKTEQKQEVTGQKMIEKEKIVKEKIEKIDLEKVVKDKKDTKPEE